MCITAKLNFLVVGYTRKKDAELVELVVKGDHKAFEELLNRYQNAVTNFAFRILQNSSETEDIVQEVFLRLYRTVNTYNESSNLQTYLFTITKNLCIDYYRKKKPMITNEPPEVAYHDNTEKKIYSLEMRDRVEKIIAGLPKNQRAAIHLCYEHSMSYQEISEVMGVTVNSTQSLIYRGRKKIREELSAFS